jgi:death on curing protein
LLNRRYLSVNDVVFIHEELIEAFGGLYGIRDNNGLQAAVMRPQSGYYQNILEEAAALMESLANNHPFIDGNKRIAFFAADIFLRMIGIEIVTDSELAYIHFMSLFDQGNFNYIQLLDWLSAHTK